MHNAYLRGMDLPIYDEPVEWQVAQSLSQTATAHELEYFAYEPSKKISKAEMEKMLKSICIPDSRIYGNDNVKGLLDYDYFTENNGSEFAVRIVQLRNCFGLKEGEPFTKEMWDYAKRHYIHDMQGTNDMIEFFDMIEQLPEGKQAEFFKWGIQHTLSAAGVVGIGVAAYGTKKDKKNTNIC